MFYVVPDAGEFFRIADPVIEGFVLPESVALAIEDAIGLMGGYAFRPLVMRGIGALGVISRWMWLGMTT